MKTFKHFLEESTVGEPDERKVIERWFYDHLKTFRPGKLYITDDGLEYEGDMVFKGSVTWKELPYKFNVIKGHFILKHSNLESFKNFPRVIGGNLNLAYCKFKSLEGIPEEVHGDVDLWGNKIKSLKGIHKHLKKMDGALNVLQNPVKGPILGILMIDGIKSVIRLTPNITPRTPAERFNLALNVINKYMGQGKAGVLEAQEFLEDRDLEEFAGL